MVLKGDKEFARGDHCSFGHDGYGRAKEWTPEAAPSSEPPTPRGRSASRKQEPQRQESFWEVRSTAVQRLLERYLHSITCFVTIGILPNVSVLSQHRKVEEQSNKKPKKNGDKNAVTIVKDVRQLGCVLQDTEPPQSSSILRKGTEVSRSQSSQ